MMDRAQIFLALSQFCRDEDGAVTTDWVLLTALVIGLVLATFNTITSPLADVATEMTDHQVKTTF
jgi:Flp pilus assembly pilin Flp